MKKIKGYRSSNCRQLGEARSNVVLRRWQWLAMLVVGLGSQQRYTEEKSEEQTSHDRGIMGARRRRSILATLAFLMLMGIALYFRLWAIHYNLSSDDTQLLRSPLSSENNILLFCAMLVLLIDTAKRNTIVLWRFFFFFTFILAFVCLQATVWYCQQRGNGWVCRVEAEVWWGGR